MTNITPDFGTENLGEILYDYYQPEMDEVLIKPHNYKNTYHLLSELRELHDYNGRNLSDKDLTQYYLDYKQSVEKYNK